MNKIENLQELFNISNLFSEKEIYFSENIFSEGKIDSVIEAYNILLNSTIENKKIKDYGYSISTEIIDGKKYFKLEKVNLVENKEKQIVLDILEEEFGESLKSVGIFGSYITKENGEYSDYDLVIVLDEYKNNDIYEREKASPKLKRKLLEKGVKSLFAFNFTTIQELENANKNNPWLLETMGKSFHILKDENSFLEKILIQNRNIEYLGNFAWKGDKLSTKENLDRIDFILKKYENILKLAEEAKQEKYVLYYKWEIEKLKIIKKLIQEQSIFVSRFDFNYICKDLLNLKKEEIKRLYKIFKDSEITGKKYLQNYSSVKNNIDFSNLLKQNNFTIESLQYRYLALKNILSELLHKTGNFILDGEFTQKFLQIFGDNLDKNIYNSFFENIFKTEQILGRTGYLSFDLNFDGNYIFEKGNFNYKKLIEEIDLLIKYFTKNKENLLNKIGVKNTKVSIISGNSNILKENNFIFPNKIEVYSKKQLENGSYPKGLRNSEYIFVLNKQDDFSADYLLKLLSGFNKEGIKCVSGNRVSIIKGVENKFHNFVFRKKDYEKNGKNIFNYHIRNIGTNYFTS